MQKRNCVVIGDSLAAIHLANELSDGDFSVLLVRPDTMPTELHETNYGAFDCDLAAGCDFSYYFVDKCSDVISDLKGNFRILPCPYRLHTPDFTLSEYGENDLFLKHMSAMFPDRMDSIVRFYNRSMHIHDLIDEIETKNGIIPPYSTSEFYRLLFQIYPWTSSKVYKLTNTTFFEFLSECELPDNLFQLYNVICHDHLGLGPESIDTMTGVDIVTRRYHGLSYPDGGWLTVKKALMNHLKNSNRTEVLGGKKVDVFKTSAGFAYEVYIDERDAFEVDWLIVDQTIGLLSANGHPGSDISFVPVGYHSNSHLDFKLFIAWDKPLPEDLLPGVNFLYTDNRYPPQAPHLIRMDVMPSDADDLFGLKSRITVRGRFPAERVATSWGENIDRDTLRDELLGIITDSVQLPGEDPVYSEFLFPEAMNNPFDKRNEHINKINPVDFALNHSNIMLIPSSGLNGGSIRLAFHGAERIAGIIKHKINVRKAVYEFAVKPVRISPNLSDVINDG